jgi:PAS domain S-box-containing protein
MISVLYVEDDTSLLEIGKFLLEKDGSITVDTCSSVSEALQNISGKRYDVIISDYAMPVTNGIKFLKTLRSRGDTTPFFFFAGKGRKSVIIEALSLGADFYLEKAGNAKVQFEELMTEVKRAAERMSASSTVDQVRDILDTVLNAVAEGVLVADPRGKIVTCNQNFRSLFKIPDEMARTSSDAPALLEYIKDQLEDPGDFSRIIADVSSDPGITCQGTIRTREGQVFSWSSRARGTGDAISGRIWCFCDTREHHETGRHLAMVTDQLRAAEEELQHLRKDREEKEEMLRKNEEILDILSRVFPDGILTSRGGTIIEANESFADMVGYSTTELAGRSLPDFVSPDSPGEVMLSLCSGYGGRCECLVLHRDGSSFRVESEGYPVGFRGDIILVSIVRRVPETPLPEKESADVGKIPFEAEPEREEAGISPGPVSEPGPVSAPGPVSEPGPEGVIRPEHAPFVSVPAGIIAKGKTGSSLTWEIDDAHLAADTVENQPSHDIDTRSLITEIDDVLGPDTSTDSQEWGIRSWLSELRRKKWRFF